MRALRRLCTHKHLLHPTTFPTSLAFFKPIQNPRFYRGVHSTTHRLLPQKPSLVSLFSSSKSETSDTADTVEDIYDPANRCVVSSDGEAGSGPENEARSGNGQISEERRHFGGGRTSYAGSGKKGKKRGCWVCSDCGYTDGQWWGSCRSCHSAGTMKQFAVEENGGGSEKARGFEVSENVVRSWMPQRAGEVRLLRLTDANRGVNQLEWRIPLYGNFGEEVSRVLGGGLVPGSLILVGGDLGVGKSTLLLQMAGMIVEGHDLGRLAPVVYVSGEECGANRADHLGIRTEELYVCSSTAIEDILEKIQVLSPRALIVDSIQTVYLKGVAGSAGSLS